LSWRSGDLHIDDNGFEATRHQLDAFFGYLTFGFIPDRLGRRLVGSLLGFFGHGYFSLSGGLMTSSAPLSHLVQ
jgi:hypothetical protein